MKYRVKRHTVVQPLDDSLKLIPLTQRQNAIVDTADYDWLNQWNWNAWWNSSSQSFYAVRNEKTATGKQPVYMHRIITENAYDRTDHRNCNTLDNRRENLRDGTASQNGANSKLRKNNSSGFKGVCWDRRCSKWKASIKVSFKHIHLGHFMSKEKAAQAYDIAALKHFGEFARINVPHSIPH